MELRKFITRVIRIDPVIVRIGPSVPVVRDKISREVNIPHTPVGANT